MKNKKVLIIVGIIILIISILIYIFISTSTKNDQNDVVKSNFTIPGDYLKKIENHMSHVDGPDIDYYIYNDKIIIDKNNYYPLGQYSYNHEHTITVYENLEINNENNINNYKELIQDKEGKVVLHIYK